MKKNFLEQIKKRRLYFDGATGSVLQSRGLPVGTPPEEWTLTRPDEVLRLHNEYLAAGANIIKTNTFGVNPFKYPNYKEYISRAVDIAKRAVGSADDKYVALDIGPLGRLLSPLGELDFEDALSAFRDTVAAADGLGVDLVLIETMNDSYETKAAVLGAREATDLPIVVTCVYDSKGKLMTGTTPEAMVAMLEGLGASAIGANCSFGPDKMIELLPRLVSRSSLPIVVNPNAGMPSINDGHTEYNVTPNEFAEKMKLMAEGGACMLGGCCGTTPEHISALVKATQNIPYNYPEFKNITTVSSFSHTVDFGERPVLIGERINPTGKPKLKDALRNGNYDYILTEAISQAERGVDIIDVNVGLPELDELSVLRRTVKEIQAVTDAPLQLDSSNPEVLGASMRIYNGKPLVNSVSGKEEIMRGVFPLVRKYGGTVIALTLDERGIPDSAEERVAIAERIIACAAEYGIDKKDIIVDPLTLPVSANKDAPGVTLRAVKLLSERGIKTSLGVSNVSFGLPARDKINAAFFSSALTVGLSVAIMNPYSEAMMDVICAHNALSGLDIGCAEYVTKYSDTTAPVSQKRENITLGYAIRHGIKDSVGAIVYELLLTRDPIDVIDREIIPALDEIGREFEAGRAYLPELLMSAEAASLAFDTVKEKMPKRAADGRKVILATVKGDIHDIGKNIVKVMLESYGFTVYDIGRDVPPERVLEAAREHECPLVGLSALMTTTVPAMKETVDLLHTDNVSVMVGGAVLTAEYAEMIGADLYAADAMGAVRVAEAFYRSNS